MYFQKVPQTPIWTSPLNLKQCGVWFGWLALVWFFEGWPGALLAEPLKLLNTL